MGSPESEDGHKAEELQHKVTFTEGFWIGETEVTQKLYQAVTGTNPAFFKNNPDLPVETVSWYDAAAFILQLNSLIGTGSFNLPTEGQWEYACRAGSQDAYCYGNDRAILGDYGWVGDNTADSKVRVKAVAGKKPNAWGIYDMHGNLWEWCLDWYGAYPEHALSDPSGPLHGVERVCRGGSWFSGKGGVRCADRDHVPPDYVNSSLGFRIVWTP